jgi:type 1 glutamine amidotransferase
MTKWLLVIGLALAVSIGTGFGQASEADPIRVLIITGEADLPYHVWQETTASMRNILGASGRFDVRTNEEPRGLNAAALEDYQVLVLNYHGPRWPKEAEEAVEQFIRNGGGFVAVHQASYGPFFGQEMRDGHWQPGPDGTGWAAFSEIIGAHWAPEDIGHARRTVFQVDWKDPNNPLCRGLPKSFMANDELYHKMQLAPRVKVLADAVSPADLGGTGRREPLVWTNQFGKGRVVFTPLGHDALAWYEPGMANLLARAVEWAATGSGTIPPVSREKRSSDSAPLRLLVVTGGHTYPVEFYAMIESLPGVVWTHATSQQEAFSNPIEKRFDAVMLHDMYEITTEQTREHLKSFIEAGKGVLSLHHAIVDYTDWPWWYQEVTGGKYFVNAKGEHLASRYREGLEFLVTPVPGKGDHPVLRGVGPLWVNDELYKGMEHSSSIEVLMETTHPDNDRPVVYVGPYQRARVVYVQLGHSADTMNNPGFRRLISNAVHWIARKPAPELE